MGFKINVDRFGFAKEPKPEKNSRDYAAQLAKKLVDKEATVRTNEDEALLGKITEEGDARRADKAELQLEIDDKVTGEKDERNAAIRNAIAEEVTARSNAIESAIAQEARARELKDNALEELIDEKVSVKADKGITLEAYGIINAYTIPEVETIKRDLKAEISKKANLINGSGGFVGGLSATASETSVSIGYGAVANNRGLSLGENAVSGADNGIAIGNRAWTYSDGTFHNTIQLGTGINAEEHTFQVYDFKLLNADGTIPEDRIPKLAEHGAEIEALKQSGGGNVDLSDYYTKLEVERKTGYELIDSGTLTEDVNAVIPDLNGNRYKEIYCYFKVAKSADFATNAEKGRIYIASGSASTDLLWDQQNWLTENFNDAWELTAHIKAFGEVCSTKVWFYKYYATPYARTPVSSTFCGGEAPFKQLSKPYIDYLDVRFSSKDGTRVLPSGTTFEIWGVRA